MALSQQDFDKLKMRLGGDVSLPELPKQSDVMGDIKETGQDLKATAKSTFGKIKDSFKGFLSGDQGMKSTLYQAGGATAGGVSSAIGDVFKGGVKAVLPESTEASVKNTIGNVTTPIVKNTMENPFVQNLMSRYESLSPEAKRDIDATLGFGQLALDIGGVGLAKRPITSAVEAGLDVAKRGTNLVAESTLKKPSIIANTILDKISAPNVSDATMASLNPVETLKRTAQDMRITVGGKSKMVSELTPEEISRVKMSTTKGIDSFTKQAEKFKVDRNVKNGSPVEIVGSRADKALQVADAKRQVVGRKMGDIETQYANDIIPMSEATYKPFVEITDAAKNPSYGTNLADSPTAAKLISDFDTLNNNGLSVAERNKFVRSWDAVLRDAKDNFGNFKENASVYTKIQNAVNKIKGETVDYLTTKDKIYRGLRKQYAEHIKLQDFGDALLGKDGLLGEKVKGAATVKRAIQSNSDAGARQFLGKLKEITGYDAIRDGDLALTAMKNVGDYQGLNLLDVLNDGKSGIIKKTLESVQNKLVGNEAERVKKFIKK